MPRHESEREKVGLPPRIFFYTVDQIGTMLELDPDYIMKRMLHFQDRSPGVCPKTKMLAVNLAPEGETPQWRIAESRFLGYLRSRGVKFYSRGFG